MFTGCESKNKFVLSKPSTTAFGSGPPSFLIIADAILKKDGSAERRRKYSAKHKFTLHSPKMTRRKIPRMEIHAGDQVCSGFIWGKSAQDIVRLSKRGDMPICELAKPCEIQSDFVPNYLLPVIAATSAAKSSSFFSRPSPVSKRTKLLSVIGAPILLPTAFRYCPTLSLFSALT